MKASALSHIMDPIIPREPARRSRAKSTPHTADTALSRGFLRFIFVLACLTALATFGLSVYFLIGFAMTDTGVLTLLSSAALCFSVGAMGYFPATLMAYWTRKDMGGDRAYGRYWLSLLLLLPWVALSLILIFKSAMPLIYGATALCITLLLLLWPLAGLRAERRARRAAAGKGRTQAL